MDGAGIQFEMRPASELTCSAGSGGSRALACSRVRGNRGRSVYSWTFELLLSSSGTDAFICFDYLDYSTTCKYSHSDGGSAMRLLRRCPFYASISISSTDSRARYWALYPLVLPRFDYV